MECRHVEVSSLEPPWVSVSAEVLDACWCSFLLSSCRPRCPCDRRVILPGLALAGVCSDPDVLPADILGSVPGLAKKMKEDLALYTAWWVYRFCATPPRAPWGETPANPSICRLSLLG